MADQSEPPPADRDEEFGVPFEDRFGTVIELNPKDKDPWTRMFAVYPALEYVRRRSVGYRWPMLAAAGLVILALAVESLATGGVRPERWFIIATTVVLPVAFALFVWNLTMRAALTVTIGRTIHLRIGTLRLVIDPRIGEKLGLQRSADGRLWNVYRTSYGFRALKFRLAAEAFPKLADFFREHMIEHFEEMKSE